MKQATGKRRHLLAVVGVAASQTRVAKGLQSTNGMMEKQTHPSLCYAVQVLSSDMLNLQSYNVRTACPVSKKVTDSNSGVLSVKSCERHWVRVTLACENMNDPLALCGPALGR